MDLNLNNFFSGLNLLLGICVFILMTTLKRVFAPFWETPLGNRLLPVFPLVFGVGLAFLGLHEPSIQTWQETLAIGLIAAFGAGYLFKVGSTSILGLDDKSQKAKIDKRKSDPPKPEEPKP